MNIVDLVVEAIKNNSQYRYRYNIKMTMLRDFYPPIFLRYANSCGLLFDVLGFDGFDFAKLFTPKGRLFDLRITPRN